jgi:hypothetical protein
MAAVLSFQRIGRTGAEKDAAYKNSYDFERIVDGIRKARLLK